MRSVPAEAATRRRRPDLVMVVAVSITEGTALWPGRNTSQDRMPPRQTLRPAPTRRRRPLRPGTRGLSQPASCSRCVQWARDARLPHSPFRLRRAAWQLTRAGPGLQPARPGSKGKVPMSRGRGLRPPGSPDTTRPRVRSHLRPAAARPGAGSRRAESAHGPVPLAGRTSRVLVTPTWI